MRLARWIGFLYVGLLISCAAAPIEPETATRLPSPPAREVSLPADSLADSQEELATLERDAHALELESAAAAAEVDARRDERDRLLARLAEVEGELASAEQQAAAADARVVNASNALAELESSIERRRAELARLDAELAERERMRASGLDRGESESPLDALVGSVPTGFLPGLHTVADPSEDGSLFLKTDDDLYLGRIEFEEDVEVVPGESVQGKVIFYPLRHRELQRDMNAAGFEPTLRFVLESDVSGSREQIPLEKKIPLYALNSPKLEVPWRLETSRDFEGGVIGVVGHLEEPQGSLARVDAPPPIIEDQFEVVTTDWLTDLHEELGIKFAALTGIVGVVGTFVLTTLGFIWRLKGGGFGEG